MSTHNTPYSPYKLVHHTDALETIKKGELPIPLQVQLIISDWCNHGCSFCAYRMDGYTSNQLFAEQSADGTKINNPVRMIPAHKCLEILDDCAAMGVKAMQFTGGGEPTVHPKHTDIFNHCVDLGMDLALVTNGAKMKDETIDALVRGGKWVRISVDAGKAETYCSVREVKPFMFERVWSNINKLTAARNASENSDLIIGIGYVVTPDNYNEIEEFVIRAVESGADNVRVSAMFSNDPTVHDEYHDYCKEQLTRVKQVYGDKIKIFDLFSDRVDDLHNKAPEYKTCTYMKLNVYIGGDLNVYSCCNNAYNLQGLMGSLKEQSFKAFWTSEDNRKRYYNYDATSCTRCMFNTKNRFANYLLEDDPVHVNYI